jgi:hypothetical protein
MREITTDSLIITEHARVRMQQRAIPMLAVDLLLQFGKRHYASGGIRLDFDKRARRRIAEHLAPDAPSKKIMSTYAVVNGELLTTIGHRTKRFAWK